MIPLDIEIGVSTGLQDTHTSRLKLNTQKTMNSTKVAKLKF